MSAPVRLDEFQELALLVLAYGGASVGDATRGGATPSDRQVEEDRLHLLALQGLAQRRGDEVHLTDAGLDVARQTFPEQHLRAPMYS